MTSPSPERPYMAYTSISISLGAKTRLRGSRISHTRLTVEIDQPAWSDTDGGARATIYAGEPELIRLREAIDAAIADTPPAPAEPTGDGA